MKNWRGPHETPPEARKASNHLASKNGRHWGADFSQVYEPWC